MTFMPEERQKALKELITEKRGIALFEEGKKCGMEEHARRDCGAMKGVLLGCK